MTNPKLEPPVDFYRERVERIDSTPEARLLRYEIAVAVNGEPQQGVLKKPLVLIVPSWHRHSRQRTTRSRYRRARVR